MAGNLNSINGYILAGGKSSRMGTDKGLLDFNGKPILQIIIDQLRPAVNRTIIVSNNREHKIFGLEVIPDIKKDKGPAGGIYAALSHTNSKAIFVMSCDMPFITTGAIQYLLERSSRAQITLPLNHGNMEPLFGVYSKECLPLWEELIQQEMIKLQEMVTHFYLLKINVDQEGLFNQSLFLNINDKNDFQKALKLIQHGD